MTLTSPAPGTADAVRAGTPGAVHLPGDSGYDAARLPWNVAVRQQPAAVAVPRTTAEVARIVRAAAAAGLRVAPQGTGHNAGPLGDLADTLLLRTSAMTGARVDPGTGRVTVRAGTLWLEAVEAAAAQRRTVLHGSSPDVGVVGYSLGGGLGWYARQLGLQANSVTGAEVVLADGSVVRADAEHEPDLFWALRGGGGLGVVTELEFASYAFTTAYGGMLLWDWSQAEQVLPRWAAWAAEAPDEVTTSFRLMQLPPFPELPPFLRGRQLVVIDGAVRTDDDARAEALLAPLRALRPEIDTFARVESASLVRLHMDPEGPTPAVSDSALLTGLPDEAIDTLLAVAGPGSGSALLAAELRQLGGAVGRPAPGAGPLPCIDGAFLLFGVAVAPDAQAARVGQASATRLVEALTPWSTGGRYLNFTERSVPAASGYDPAAWHRLRRVRAAVDPTGLFRANHPITD